MDDKREDGQPEESVEGVRIVDKAEAEAALESGTAISRKNAGGGRLISLVGYQSDDPEPTWADTDDPTSADSSSMRILGPSDRVSATLRMPETSRSSTGSNPMTTAVDDDFDLLDLRMSSTPDDDTPSVQRDNDAGKLIMPDTGSHQMPHWTEQPSGEVPIFPRDTGSGNSGVGGTGFGSSASEDSGSRAGDGDNADEPTNQWSLDDLGIASRLGREEDDALDAAFEALGEVPAINPDDTKAATKAKSAAESNESSSKSKTPEPLVDKTVPTEDEPNLDELVTPTAEERTKPFDAIEEKVESLKKASIVTRSGTAIVAAALAIAAFAAGPTWTMAMALLVVTLSAVEYFDALRRVGYRPATALGLLSVVGVMLGTYWRGDSAIPLVLGLSLVFTFLWYLSGIIRENPTANISATLMGVVWTGVLGSYAALMLRAPDHEGIAFFGAAVILVIAYDTFAYLGGVLIGRHKLIPSVSPSKTWEGLAVASVACVLFGLFVVPQIHPWGYGDGLILGIVVAFVSPLGDLAESLVKRDLGLKDMGRLLPGHGGVLDRFDALLFVLPATYYVCRALNLI